MSRSNEKKLQQLKFVGVPWVTIHTPTYPRTPSTSGSNTPSVRSTTELPPIEPSSSTKPLFNHSLTTFSDVEANMIRIATADEIDGVPLHKSPSRLQQIQMAQQELHPEFVLGRVNSIDQSNSSFNDQNRRDEDMESIISLDDNDDRYEPIGADDSNMSTSRKHQKLLDEANYSTTNFIGSGPVSKEEIQDHIWEYCNDCSVPVTEKKIKAISANFVVDENLGAARINTSYGMRKKLNTITLYSGVEKERQEFRARGPLLTHQSRKRLESSISAMRYSKFIMKQNRELPEFLDGLDFSNAKTKYSKKKAARTQPVSPRNPGLRPRHA